MQVRDQVISRSFSRPEKRYDENLAGLKEAVYGLYKFNIHSSQQAGLYSVNVLYCSIEHQVGPAGPLLFGEPSLLMFRSALH